MARTPSSGGRGSSAIQPVTIEILVRNAADSGIMAGYKWAIGLSDLDSQIITDVKNRTLNEFKPPNDFGVVAFRGEKADVRGGYLSLTGLLLNGKISSMASWQLTHTLLYSKIISQHLFCEVIPLFVSESRTSNSATDKTTVGGKAGVSYGIGSGEISGSREHGGATSSITETGQGRVFDIDLRRLTPQ